MKTLPILTEQKVKNYAYDVALTIKNNPQAVNNLSADLLEYATNNKVPYISLEPDAKLFETPTKVYEKVQADLMRLVEAAVEKDTFSTDILYQLSDCVDDHAPISGGDTGSHTSYEYAAARNTVMVLTGLIIDNLLELTQ